MLVIAATALTGAVAVAQPHPHPHDGEIVSDTPCVVMPRVSFNTTYRNDSGRYSHDSRAFTVPCRAASLY